jgi:hypothetical protein
MVKENTTMSTVIHLEEILPGMVLGAPILNRYGQTLLASGIVIDEKHLLMFKTWGIKHVTIEGEPQKSAEESEISEDLINLAKNHIKKRLMWDNLNPLEEDLFNAAVERIIDTYSSTDLEAGND